MLDLFKKCHGNNSQSREKINFTSTQLFPLGRLQIKYFNKKILFIVFNVFKMGGRHTYIVCRELKEAIFLSDHHAPSPQNKKSLITLKFFELKWLEYDYVFWQKGKEKSRTKWTESRTNWTESMTKWTDSIGQIGHNLGQTGQKLGQTGQNLGRIGQNLGQIGLNLGQIGQNLGQTGQNLGQMDRSYDKMVRI